MLRFRLWWQRRHWRNCPTCGFVLTSKTQRCGNLKVEDQVFPDGGWVLWQSWTPCSEHAKRGVHPERPLLDDAGDLDDVRGLDGSVLNYHVGVR